MELNNLMKSKKITTKRLAELTGINPRTIEGYRQCRREPSLAYGLKIARALNVSPYDLIDNTPKL